MAAVLISPSALPSCPRSLSIPPSFRPFPPLFSSSPSFFFDERRRTEISDTMDMSSESSTARWYEPPRSSLEPPSGGAGVAGVVGNPSDYRGYYPHAGPTAHHPAAAHYAHSKCTRVSFFSFRAISCVLLAFFLSSPRRSSRSLSPFSRSLARSSSFHRLSSPSCARGRFASRFNDRSISRPADRSRTIPSRGIGERPVGRRQKRAKILEVENKKRASPFSAADTVRLLRR